MGQKSFGTGPAAPIFQTLVFFFFPQCHSGIDRRLTPDTLDTLDTLDTSDTYNTGAFANFKRDTV